MPAKSDTQKMALHVENVTVRYGRFEAIRDVDLQVKMGEFMGLIGLNGAGKTTLIKAILNLRPADKGRISIFGVDSKQAQSKERIAFLPERFEPSWFMNGMEFLHFATKLYRTHPDYIPHKDEAFREMAERLALDPDALNKRVHTYSKGMRQKLGLISTLMTAAEFLILDEPMSGLDPKARSKVKDVLLDMKSKGKTVLICSHILADMDEICERVAIVDDRRLGFVGTPAELKNETGKKKLERAFLQFIEKKKAA